MNLSILSSILTRLQISETRQKRLLVALVLQLVLQHLVPERLAEVERLEDGIAVASVAELRLENLIKTLDGNRFKALTFTNPK